MLKSVSLKDGFIALFIGQVVTQAIATAHVFHSNQFLYQKTKALTEAGFVTVPNALVQPLLPSFKTAFCGGIFFTATLGTLLTVLTIMLVIPALNLSKSKAALLLLFGVGLIVLVNQHGLNLFATAYVAIVPLAVGLFLWQKAVTVSKTDRIQMVLWSGVGVVALTLLFAAALPENGFIRFRDRILLSHRAGQTANDFYYRYTLFAAEAIKSNTQKQLISYHIEKPADSRLNFGELQSKLVRHDYLRLNEKNNGKSVDLTLKEITGQELMLEDHYGTTSKTTMAEILSAPKTILSQFSKSSDRNQGLRQLILIGLLFGLPFFIYGALFCVGYSSFKWWLQPGLAAAGSTALCLIVGVALWWMLWIPGSLPDQTDELVSVLKNGHPNEQLAVLETLAHQRIDLTKIPFYQNLLQSPDIAVRYKVAQSLGSHRHRQSRESAEHLLKDSNPNVRCMALQSLGRLGDSDDIQLILKTIRESNHWYVQYYAYRALRRLGWVQPVGTKALLN